jgi:hypothetical protein
MVPTFGLRFGSLNLYNRSFNDLTISAGDFWRPLPPNKNAIVYASSGTAADGALISRGRHNAKGRDNSEQPGNAESGSRAQRPAEQGRCVLTLN